MLISKLFGIQKLIGWTSLSDSYVDADVINQRGILFLCSLWLFLENSMSFLTLVRLLIIILIVVGYDLRTSYLVLQSQAFLDFDVHAIAQTGSYLFALISLLLVATFYDIYKGRIAAKLDGTLRNGEYMGSLCQYNLGIGAVT